MPYGLDGYLFRSVSQSTISVMGVAVGCPISVAAKMRPSNRARLGDCSVAGFVIRFHRMSILQTSTVNLAVFGHCHPTLATFNHADWLADPRGARRMIKELASCRPMQRQREAA